MLSRIWRYLVVMFPPHVHVPAGVVSFWAPYALGMRLAGGSADWRSPAAWAGTVSTVLFMLLLRVMDELKDYETDKRLFKHRPLVTGEVRLSDLRALLVVVSLALVTLNFWWGSTVSGAFLIAFIYAFLMFRYFFVPAIAQSLVLALVTHNPFAALVALYTQSFVARELGMASLQWTHAALVVLFWFPLLAWEIGRKVRAPTDETEYVTYTKLFGVRPTLAMLFAFCALPVVLMGLLLSIAGWSLVPFLMCLLVLAFLGGRFLAFSRAPWSAPVGFRTELEVLAVTINLGVIIAASI